MIKFDGHLTGRAEKHFHKRARELGQKIILLAELFLLPVAIYISWGLRSWQVIVGYLLLFGFIFLLTFIPKSAKEKKAWLPKRINVEDEYISCVADKYSESKRIDEAKCVLDFGEFYEVVFPFGKMSEKFICQKSLLTEGTLEEFEALFADKIKRK